MNPVVKQMQIPLLSSTEPEKTAPTIVRKDPAPEKVQERPALVESPSAAARRMNQAGRWVRELGWNLISSRSFTAANHRFSEYDTLALRVNYKLHSAEDSYVRDAEVRQACTALLQKSTGGRRVVWAETMGVVEIGAGHQGTLPFARFCGGAGDLNYGFNAEALMRFRTSQAFALSYFQDPTSLLKEHRFRIPFSADEAKAMPYGSEIELTGQGKLATNIGGQLRVGPNVGPATAGVATSISSSSSRSKEYSVNVLSVDGRGKVRVTIRQVDEKASALWAKLQAGLIFPSLTMVPSWGQGAINYLVKKATGLPTLEEFINSYTTLTVNIGHNKAHRDMALGSFDFDLNNPRALRAYEQMLKLDFRGAEDLAVKSDSGVTKLSIREIDDNSSDHVSVGLLGEKLLLAESLNSESMQQVTRTDGSLKIHRQSNFKKRYEGWFSGTKEIEWEAVSVDDSRQKEIKPYFRFHFQRKDFCVDKGKVDNFFCFAKSMGIRSSELIKDLKDRQRDYQTVLADAKEINTHVDVYFTQDGIKRIDKSEEKEAYEAFLASVMEIKPDCRDLPLLLNNEKGRKTREIMDEYVLAKKNSHWYSCCQAELDALRDQYWALCGRSIANDADAVKQAKHFAAAIDNLTDAADAKQISTFFTSLGKTKGFDFMPTMSALQKLAGEKDTLIHNLTLNGGGITIKSRDEGVIEHPRENTMKLLMRTA